MCLVQKTKGNYVYRTKGKYEKDILQIKNINCKKIEIMEKNKIEILQVEGTKNEMKIYQRGSTLDFGNRSINEAEDMFIEILQSEEYTDKRVKKMNRGPETYGTPKRILTYA